ncbi:unnamed protein product [Trichogramma brassicae]|uniref:RNA-directed DNA polymerase n=1 Tax=Trichogramma brassicae TaxID=86971 RepID=A0A6H5IZ53_9HYME|nr:unnamed protein product [Trichogramma brassicae]
MSVESYIERIEECAFLAGLSDADLLPALSETLSGTAAQWFRSNRHKFQSWEEFCRMARKTFGMDQYTYQQLLEQIRRRTQGRNERVAQYIIGLQSTLDKLRPQLAIQTQLDYLHGGMLPELQKMVRRKTLRSIDDLFDEAVEAENTILRAEQYRAPTQDETVSATRNTIPDEKNTTQGSSGKGSVQGQLEGHWWIKAQVGNHEIRNFYDTGASRTTMNSIAMQFARECERKITPIRGRMTQCANGSMSIVTAYVELPFTVGGITRDIRVDLMPDLWTDCVVGANFIKTFQARHNPTTNQCIIGPNNIPVPMEFVPVGPVTSPKIAAAGLGEMTQREREQLEKLLDEILQPKTGPLSHTNLIEHSINIKEGTKPIKQRYYPVSEKLKEELHQQVRDLLENDIIETSSSGWSSPIVMVKKSNDKNLADDDERKMKLVVQREQRPVVLRECHDEPTAAHLGREKTYDRLAERYFWPKMYTDVADYVRKCKTCQQIKVEQRTKKGLMGHRVIPRPWHTVAADVAGPFPRSNSGFEYMLIFEDLFSKWVECIPIRQANGKTILKYLKERIVLRYGPPTILQTDNGTEFRNTLIDDYLKETNIGHYFNPGYYPQVNPVERTNRTYKTMIKAYIDDNHREWDEKLPEITFAYNTAKQSSTGMSPAELIYGRKPEQPGSFRREVELEGQDQEQDEALQAWKIHLDKLPEKHETAAENMKKANEKQAKYYNANRRKTDFEVGEKVWKINKVLSDASKARSSKLARNFAGPFTITEKIGENTMETEPIQQKLEEMVAQLTTQCARNPNWTAMQLCKDMVATVEEIYRQAENPPPREARGQTGNPSGEKQATTAEDQWAEIEAEFEKLWRKDDQLEKMLAGTFDKFHRFEAEWGEEAAQYSAPHRRNVQDWKDERKAIREFREEREKKRRMQDETAARAKAELKAKRDAMEKIRKERDLRDAELRKLQAEAQEAEERLERAQAIEVLGSIRACFRCNYPGICDVVPSANVVVPATRSEIHNSRIITKTREVFFRYSVPCGATTKRQRSNSEAGLDIPLWCADVNIAVFTSVQPVSARPAPTCTDDTRDTRAEICEMFEPR